MTSRVMRTEVWAGSTQDFVTTEDRGFLLLFLLRALRVLRGDNRASLANLASGYNGTSNENLGDPGFAGGTAVGAGRPELSRAAASYRAIGDEVPSAAIRSATVREQPIHDAGANTGYARVEPECGDRCQCKFLTTRNGPTEQPFATGHFQRAE